MHCNSTIISRGSHDSFFMQCPFPMWIFDSENLQFLEVNQAAIATYGYTREEFLNMTILNIRPVEDNCSIIEIVNESKRSKKSYKHNHRHKKRNGDLIQVTIASSYVEFEGRMARVVLILDITEVLKANERLALYDQRLKSILQQGSELTAIINSDSNFTFVGPSSLSILGIPSESLIGKNILDFVHADERERIAKKIAAIHYIDFLNIAPFRFKTIHGEWRWLELKITNFLNDEAVSGIVCNGIDITNKFLEVDRRMQEEKWSKILESMVINNLDGVIVTSEDLENKNTIIYVNKAVLNISGYTREELIGKSPTVLYRENLDQPGLKILAKALKEKTLCRVELVNYTKSGKEYHTCTSISPVFNDDGEVTHWIFIHQDITKYKYEVQELKAELHSLK